jgi:hypothetical protein
VFAIQPQYSYAENFSDDGYAVVYINSDPDNIDCLIIDMNGSAVFGPVDWIFLDESPTLSPFYETGKYG